MIAASPLLGEAFLYGVVVTEKPKTCGHIHKQN